MKKKMASKKGGMKSDMAKFAKMDKAQDKKLMKKVMKKKK